MDYSSITTLKSFLVVMSGFCAWPPNNWIMWFVWGAVYVKTNNSVNISFTRQCVVSWRQSCQVALVLRRQILTKTNNFNRGDKFNWSDKFEVICQLRRKISAELGPRDQLSWNQLPIDQLPTESTPIKSTSHEINCNIIRAILKFHPRGNK